jgi:hypothetical protein
MTIVDDDTTKPTVTVTATDPNASEAGTNSGFLTFTRTGGNNNVALTITLTEGGTATQFSDYSGVYSSVTIPAGSTTTTAEVYVYNDLIIEPAETVIVTISPDPNNLYIVGAQNSATVTITDDDTVKPTVTVAATDPTAAEPGATVDTGTFTFTRTGGNTDVSLTLYLSVSGTATQFTDYTGVSSSITIPAGSTTATFTVSPYQDTVAEGTETVVVTIITDPNSIYLVGGASSATVNILNTP